MINRDQTFIIAELSANHNNDLDLAKQTIKAMKEAGADAVKFQTYTADSLSLDVDNEYFKPLKGGLWDGYRPYDLYKEAATPLEWHPELAAYASSMDLAWFSSPFDKLGVNFLESLGCPIYKIASFEITDLPLIEYVASKGKPMIISTGVAEFSDIEQAVEVCKKVGNEDITLLKCTSEYPASTDNANLRTMLDIERRFGVKVGVSDHSMGSLVPTIAVSLGAVVVEKHFILDRGLTGPDSAFSMEPKEFKEMVETVRAVESALGEVTYKVSEENQNRRRSLFVVKDIKAGEVFTESNVRSIRPGYGLHPKYLNDILGKKASRDIERGSPIEWDII